MEDWGEVGQGGRNHIKLEMSIRRHPGRDAREAARITSLESQGEIRVGDINLRVISVWMVFKPWACIRSDKETSQIEKRRLPMKCLNGILSWLNIK